MKICCIFNIGAHYRESIYKKIDLEFHPDFYIGEMGWQEIKTMRYEDLAGFRGVLKHRKVLGEFYWQSGELKLAFKNYDQYLITGSPYCLSTWILLLILKMRGKKTYAWTHGYYGKEDRIRMILKNMFFSLNTKVLLYGNMARELMSHEGFSPDKLLVIYNSLDYDKQLAVRKHLVKTGIYSNYFGNDNPVIIYVGRLQAIKRLDLLIDAICLLNSWNKLNIVFVGKPISDYNLEKIVKNKKIEDQVWMYGECFDEQELGELFFNASVCVSPGNVGLTALHSLMYGTPVLTHDSFEHQMPEYEIVESGITGDFFHYNNVDDLAKVIKQWIIYASSKREEIRFNCFSLVDQYYNPNYQIQVLRECFYIS